MEGPNDRLIINNQGKQHIQAYIDYMNMGGNSDAFSEKAYNQLKSKHAKYSKNKLYVTWRNANGKDCKTIGVATKCFCNHR